MDKADFTSLAQSLGQSAGDADTLSAFFDEAVESLARLSDPPLVVCELFPYYYDTPEHDFPANAVVILALFFEGTHLDKTNVRHLLYYSLTWRDDTGNPEAWAFDEQSARKIRLYPYPSTTETFSRATQGEHTRVTQGGHTRIIH